jgi:hypothetical protein
MGSRHQDRLADWLKTKLNSMVWVRERTIPTDRPPLVDEVIANFVRLTVGCKLTSTSISTSCPTNLPRGPPKLLSKGYRGALFPVLIRPGREADHSRPTSTEVKKTWIYTSIPPIRLQGVVLNLLSTGTALSFISHHHNHHRRHLLQGRLYSIMYGDLSTNQMGINLNYK